MKQEIEVVIPSEKINDYEFLRIQAAQKLRINLSEITSVQAIRRSVDARSRNPVYRIKAIVYINEEPAELRTSIQYKPVQTKKNVVIVGMGPAGMFAALRLIELGIKPIIVERGKDVQLRRKDLKAIQQEGNVNPDSNYCFGEGGAGTYSDGKLYTRSTKRGDVGRILNIFVQHGAHEEILIDAHPHIGSNKLPKVVQSIRETIINCGGEIHFDSRVTDFVKRENKVCGVVVNQTKEILADAVILATGHSARDIYYLLDQHKIKIEAKPFAMGVRIEHPQALIDEMQYHSKERNPNLPASSYSLTCQIDQRGVYSFCMCPGGIIIPASTDKNELVLNGMSVSRRDSPFANSGFVVSINENDWKDYSSHGVFAGLEFQKSIERIAFEAGGKIQRAPAQRITDFVKGITSNSLPKTSYIPGTISSPLHELLPEQIANGLKQSLFIFDKKMKGYLTEEAQILAAETRTSSPIKIPRNSETLMHVEVEGLFPCGEGAGYAGGIVSAAIDGERSAEAAAKFFNFNN
ncbi:MAG: FAD dependent oxidoreductase [Stygiobacter sp.]|nr:MAG: FAD dependent oxidoreductase [Stygiobacter sp.]KAF0215368.1 MAG: FAD dependent [Ignavibacteria bacterium]